MVDKRYPGFSKYPAGRFSAVGETKSARIESLIAEVNKQTTLNVRKLSDRKYLVLRIDEVPNPNRTDKAALADFLAAVIEISSKEVKIAKGMFTAPLTVEEWLTRRTIIRAINIEEWLARRAGARAINNTPQHSVADSISTTPQLPPQATFIEKAFSAQVLPKARALAEKASSEFDERLATKIEDRANIKDGLLKELRAIFDAEANIHLAGIDAIGPGRTTIHVRLSGNETPWQLARVCDKLDNLAEHYGNIKIRGIQDTRKKTPKAWADSTVETNLHSASAATQSAPQPAR